MKLSEWAKKQGVSYKTAWRWFTAGKMPVSAEQMDSGTIIVDSAPESTIGKVVIYARVSSGDQKSDLDRQVSRNLKHATEKGFSVAESVCEIGSALNGNRPKLKKLLCDPNVKVIVVEHRDRLIRFGFEYIEETLSAHGRKIIVVENSELKDDLVRDMIEVLTSFCARLYGRRAAQNRAKRAFEATK